MGIGDGMERDVNGRGANAERAAHEGGRLMRWRAVAVRGVI